MAFAFILYFAPILSFLFASALAAPLEKRTISSDVYNSLAFFEQFAAASYCPGNSDGSTTNQKLTCAAGNCPLVEADDVTAVYEFDNSLLTDVTGYIAVDKTRDLTVLAFRGSKSVRNYIADASFKLVPTDICDGCTADEGFWNSWVEARSGIIASLKATAAKYPSSKVVVTGHSLGAAIAELATAEIKKAGTPADLYNFGSPRVSGSTLASFVSNQGMGGIYRVTHVHDPVPRLPPTFLGFRHISPEYYINSGNGVTPTPADITKFDDGNDLRGNAGNNPFKSNLGNHGWYFNQIGACGGGGFEFKQ